MEKIGKVQITVEGFKKKSIVSNGASYWVQNRSINDFGVGDNVTGELWLDSFQDQLDSERKVNIYKLFVTKIYRPAPQAQEAQQKGKGKGKDGEIPQAV
jgi:hypothetical protein